MSGALHSEAVSQQMITELLP